MATKFIKIIQSVRTLRHQLFSGAFLLAAVFAISTSFLISSPAQAAIDDYVRRYLKVTEPIPLKVDELGQTKKFTPEDLRQGKELFKENCINCHVGGKNIPFPPVSLSLNALGAAAPARDNINNLVQFMRQPMTYDGSEETFWCRQVTERWMPQQQVEQLAAFILRAAEKAPGWGTANDRRR